MAELQVQKVVRKLRGHTDSVLCCVSSPSSPNLLTSSSEDGSACVFDIRSKTYCQRLQCFGGQSVVSLILGPGNGDILYAGAGSQVYCLDLRLGPTGSPLQTYTFNTEEINQVAVNPKGTYLAASDDSGETKVMDLQTHRLFKTLQGAHTNDSLQKGFGSSGDPDISLLFPKELICSTVQFHPRRPWEVLTGGLDSKIVKWDFSRGRPLHVVDLTPKEATNDEGVGRICNPPFVHALSVMEGEIPGEAGKLMAAARGDGAIDVFDLSFESTTLKSPSQTSRSQIKAMSSRKLGEKGEEVGSKSENGSHPHAPVPGRKRHLHTNMGGHASTVNHVAFARFGEKGRFLVSGGNDAFIKLWDWALPGSSEGTSSNQEGPLVTTIKHNHKVNWLSTTAGNTDNLVVADTSKVLSIYSIL